MNKEIEVKKRGWVKNAAIVFLLVMLLLTFFSNTILNRSLPEVAAQYTQSDTITSRIRGSGTVEANEIYEVIASQTYTISQISVKVGDIIEAGDVLILLDKDSNDELKQTEEALEKALVELERMILKAPYSEYAADYRSIQAARTALSRAKDDVKDAQTELNSAKSVLSAMNFDEALYKTAAAERDDAELLADTRKAEEIVAQRNLKAFEDTYLDNRKVTDDPEYMRLADIANQAAATVEKLVAEIDALKLKLSKMSLPDVPNMPVAPVQPDPDDLITYPLGDQDPKYIADKAAYDRAKSEYDKAKSEYDKAKSAYDKAKGDIDKVESDIAVSQATLVIREREAKAAKDEFDAYLKVFLNAGELTEQTEYKQLSATLNMAILASKDAENALDLILINNAALFLSKERFDEASKAVKDATAALNTAKDVADAAQRSLDNETDALESKQRAAGVVSSDYDIDIREKNKEIDNLHEKLGKLESDGSISEITAAVSGKITSITVSPGKQTIPDTPMMSIELIDRGYTLSIPVTSEQSTRVNIGDMADIDRGWWSWGNPLTAVLSNIRPDPQNPAGGRLLVFNVTGDDVESGTQLNVTISQRSENYGVVVPNSAIRTDANGDFILIVETRQSPLRNRYIARRVDINILASDDFKTAISGAGLGGGDFIITTSTKPIEPGMQIRLVDN